MNTPLLVQLPYREAAGYYGNKTASLNWLLKKGFQIPRTWVVPANALQELAAGEPGILADFQAVLEDSFRPDRRYAVRSSANLEDGPRASYAGQFQSLLDIPGDQSLLAALHQVWEGAHQPRIEAYQAGHRLSAHDLEMNALIQEMVQPVFSGVAFSINPLTGLNEIVVEAVKGAGEALVQEGVTPWRWIQKWGSYLEQPEESPIDTQLIDQICRGTAAIAEQIGGPVDLEWVYDGDQLYWVQMREVTARDIPIYSNHISREVFPGLIKPLIWSVNVPLVNGAWVRLLTELIGPNQIQPEELSRSFFYRAYFNMGVIGQIMELMGFPRDTLELLMGLEIEGVEKPTFKPGPKTFSLLPRMLGFVLSKIGFGHRVERQANAAWAVYQDLLDLDLVSLNEGEILAHIQSHFQSVQQTAYFNILAPLMMQLFNLVLDRRLERLGLDPRQTNLRGKNQDYDPYHHLQDLYLLYKALSPENQQILNKEGRSALQKMADASALKTSLETFLAQFGHLSDAANDFSHLPWRENPDLVLKMIQNHDWPGRKGNRATLQELDLTTLQRWRLAPAYRRAIRYQNLREQIGSTYTLGYGLFRDPFRELGKRFQVRGLIDEVDDIMYLAWEEIRAAVHNPIKQLPFQLLISDRKAEMEAAREVHTPPVIIGDQPVIPVEDSSDILKGVPTSRGVYSGPARVVQGLEDMDRVQEGDVLVIPYSDVSWTPLFVKAGAVVAEAGGILSHSSIIAREYGIPAVVAVPGACRLPDDTLLTVDGNNGQVIPEGKSGT